MQHQLEFLLISPLLSALVIVLFFRKSKWGGAALSVASAFATLCVVFCLLFSDLKSGVYRSPLEFFRLGKFSMDMGFLFDDITANMIFVVCLVGFLIHVFSVGYMDTDSSKGRFFAGMSFFMFSMTGIVLSSNLLMMFVFWEFVGFSSYSLIAHYADTAVASDASKKAFIVNRVGDFGFLLGIIFCWNVFGTVDFYELKEIFKASPGEASTAMGMLVMCGFLGKSAQFPLQVWLPDAMAGPTPVSALIHAATMVAAGIYMMVRLAAIGFLTPQVADLVLVSCSLMAFLAGLWALGQSDIKKILAYSTLAHLGLMGAGVALDYRLAMFHLTTHAFFKAALFLAAGSIIHACRHEQDIFKMGGLFKRMPLTSVVALVATLSIMAAPYFSGYYSKDAILVSSFGRFIDGGFLDKTAFCLILGGAVLTPVYMCRLFFNVFLGNPSSEKAAEAVESSPWMTLPLIVLAVYSLCGAWAFPYELEWLGGKMDFLVPSSAAKFVSGAAEARAAIPYLRELKIGTVLLTLAGVAVSWFIYGPNRRDMLRERGSFIYSALAAHGWFDELYSWYVAKVQQRIAIFLGTFVDLFLIELLCVRGAGAVCAVVGQGFKRMHDCSANSQSRWIVAGVIMLFVLITVQ